MPARHDDVPNAYAKAEKEERLGRKSLDCEHAEKCANVDAVISVLAMPYCGTALAADWVSNLLLCSSDGQDCHLSASQTAKMGPSQIAYESVIRCWSRALRTHGTPLVSSPKIEASIYLGIHHDEPNQRRLSELGLGSAERYRSGARQ